MNRIRGDLLERTCHFAECILAVVDGLPNNAKGWVLAKQLIRCGTAIGANVREADHAITDSDFAYKCSIARKEASECNYWLELCKRAGLLTGDAVDRLISESDELTRILASIVKGTQEHIQRKH